MQRIEAIYLEDRLSAIQGVTKIFGGTYGGIYIYINILSV